MADDAARGLAVRLEQDAPIPLDAALAARPAKRWRWSGRRAAASRRILRCIAGLHRATRRPHRLRRRHLVRRRPRASTARRSSARPASCSRATRCSRTCPRSTTSWPRCRTCPRASARRAPANCSRGCTSTGLEGAPAAAALRRAAAARRGGARAGARPAGAAARRAVLGGGPGDAAEALPRTGRTAPLAGAADRAGHARPGRGRDAGRPHVHAAPRPHAADRHARST